jgi:hypothetical protein
VSRPACQRFPSEHERGMPSAWRWCLGIHRWLRLPPKTAARVVAGRREKRLQSHFWPFWPSEAAPGKAAQGFVSEAVDRRPLLRSALSEARKHKRSIVVAKPDRLSRDFIAG